MGLRARLPWSRVNSHGVNTDTDQHKSLYVASSENTIGHGHSRRPLKESASAKCSSCHRTETWKALVGDNYISSISIPLSTTYDVHHETDDADSNNSLQTMPYELAPQGRSPIFVHRILLRYHPRSRKAKSRPHDTNKSIFGSAGAIFEPCSLARSLTARHRKCTDWEAEPKVPRHRSLILRDRLRSFRHGASTVDDSPYPATNAQARQNYAGSAREVGSCPALPAELEPFPDLDPWYLPDSELMPLPLSLSVRRFDSGSELHRSLETERLEVKRASYATLSVYSVASANNDTSEQPVNEISNADPKVVDDNLSKVDTSPTLTPSASLLCSRFTSTSKMLGSIRAAPPLQPQRPESQVECDRVDLQTIRIYNQYTGIPQTALVAFHEETPKLYETCSRLLHGESCNSHGRKDLPGLHGGRFEYMRKRLYNKTDDGLPKL